MPLSSLKSCEYPPISKNDDIIAGNSTYTDEKCFENNYRNTVQFVMEICYLDRAIKTFTQDD